MRKFILLAAIISLSTSVWSQQEQTTASTDGTLTVTATTSQTSNPQYAPRNIVAMYILDNSNKFVKTMLAYAGERKQYLVNWKSVTAIAGSPYNTVDAITGATKSSHASRTCTWDGLSIPGASLPDGVYTIRMESTDNDGSKQNLASFTFTKGPDIQILTPSYTSGFSNITIKWFPIGTSVDQVNASAKYLINPNPAINKISISGEDINMITVFTLDGNQLLQSPEKVIDISNLPKGVYLANISTAKGIISRKLIKE